MAAAKFEYRFVSSDGEVLLEETEVAFNDESATRLEERFEKLIFEAKQGTLRVEVEHITEVREKLT